jgi:hypothetical protein
VAIGLVVEACGIALAFAPVFVADALGRPHDTPTQLINLRASWGGALAGIGAFVAWLPAWRPRWRVVVGLAMWTMAGVGAARLVGFALDGSPDARQYVWIAAEAAIVIGCALVLQRSASSTRLS